jgi:hypothetical protein
MRRAVPDTAGGKQTDRDYDALVKAVKQKRVPAAKVA